MENVKKLEFDSVDFEQYGTKRINIQNGFLKLKKQDFKIIKNEKTKYGYQKAVLQLNQRDLRDLMKDWEAQINEYLKDEGIGPITILYGDKIYPKTHLNNTTNASIIKIISVWINNENKPFPQLWFE